MLLRHWLTLIKMLYEERLGTHLPCGKEKKRAINNPDRRYTKEHVINIKPVTIYSSPQFIPKALIAFLIRLAWDVEYFSDAARTMARNEGLVCH